MNSPKGTEALTNSTFACHRLDARPVDIRFLRQGW